MDGTSKPLVSVGAGAIALVISAVLIGVAGARPAVAATFYVRTAGDDANDGLTPATAFRHIRYAAESILNAGDRVVVGPGTYREGSISPPRNGIAHRPVVFTADRTGAQTGDPPGEVIIQPPTDDVNQTTGFTVFGKHDIVIDGFTIIGAPDAGVQVRADRGKGVSSHSIAITNNVVRNSAKRGIDVSIDGSVTIQGNATSDNGSAGITVQGEPDSTATVEILDNTVAGSLGILVQGVNSGSIADNTISNTTEAGIRVGTDPDTGRPSHTISITRNAVRNSATRGIDVVIDEHATIRGNTATDNGSSGIRVQGASGSSVTLDVSENTVTTSQGPGIVVHGVSGGTIDGNAISDSSDTGLQIRTSSALVVSRNVVRNSHNGGIGIGVAPAAAVGDCDGDGSVSINELLVGVNIVLGNQPLSECSAFDSQGVGEVNVADLVSAINAALGSTSSDPLGGDFTVVDNDVDTSAAFGISINASGQVAARRNRVLHSGTTALSIRLSDTATAATVAENILGISGDHGVFLSGMARGTVQNNVIFSNASTGITVRAATNVQIANNLIYANQSHGVAIGTGGADEAAADASIVNNTIYQNGLYGLVVGNELVASPRALVVNNIFNANAGGGIGIQRLSADAGYVTGFNLNTDGYGSDTRAGVYDFSGDPLFVDPPGLDGVLGGDGFDDDDFRLRGNVNPTQRSAAIDAGSGPTSSVGVTGSAVQGSAPDTGRVDLGYHYGASSSQAITVAAPDLDMPIYVRVHGDPSHDGLSPAQALPSIAAAALKATSSTTIIVGPGRYNEGDIRLRHLTRDVSFIADPTGASTGDPPGVVLVDATTTGKETGFVMVDAPGTVIDGFHVTGGIDAGIQVRAGSDGAQVRNSVVFSNRRRGLEALDAHDVVFENNLVYANSSGGIRVSQSDNSMVLNNTSYGNGDVGLLIGGGEELVPTRGTVVLRNIVQNNQRGVLVTANAQEAYVTGFNVALDGFLASTPRADSDFIADALFVNPAGADGILGSSGFADDDFHLLQDGAFRSPAVDIDDGEIDVLTHGSTRGDGAPDSGPADAGYHYPVR